MVTGKEQPTAMLLFAFVESFFFSEYKSFWCIKARGTALGLSLIPVIFYTYNGTIGRSPDWINISIFFVSAAICFARSLAARRFLRTMDEKASGGAGRAPSKKSGGIESWERRRTEKAGRFGASSKRRSSWFIRVRVGFATSESSRRTADSARGAFR